MVNKKKVSETIIVKSLEKRAAVPLKKIQAVKKIKNNDHNVIVADNLKILKELRSEGMRQLHEIVDPINSSVSKIRALFQPFFTMVQETEAEYKEKMYVYIEGKEKKKLELEQSYSKGKIGGLKLEQEKQKNEVATGASNIRKVWTVVEVDADKTPRKFLIPDEAAIRKALQEGKKVAGWEWRQVNNIAI